MECLLKISREYRVEPRPVNDLTVLKLDDGKVLKKKSVRTLATSFSDVFNVSLVLHQACYHTTGKWLTLLLCIRKVPKTTDRKNYRPV